jgi:membrane-bound metal-dependent hydrolase YbcI (DUF457 family)
VDPVTHTLVGAGMANAFFRRRVGRESVPILAIASNLPDLDGVVHLTGSPAALMMRRTFGHSIFLVPVWSLLLALALRRFYPRVGLARLYGLAILGAGVHLFFDLINSFGVVLLWPFSGWRPELALVFIIDLVLTGLLALPLLVAILPAARPHLARMSRAALVCVGLYLALCGAGRHLAGLALAREAETLGRSPDFAYVFPEPLGPHRWRGVLREGDLYSVYLVHPLSGETELKETIRTEIADPLVEEVRHSDFGRRLEAFFKAPVWRVEPPSSDRAEGARGETAPGAADEEPSTGERVVGSGLDPSKPSVGAYDLRFLSLVLARRHVFEYTFQPGPDGRLGPPTWQVGPGR